MWWIQNHAPRGRYRVRSLWASDHNRSTHNLFCVFLFTVLLTHDHWTHSQQHLHLIPEQSLPNTHIFLLRYTHHSLPKRRNTTLQFSTMVRARFTQQKHQQAEKWENMALNSKKRTPVISMRAEKAQRCLVRPQLGTRTPGDSHLLLLGTCPRMTRKVPGVLILGLQINFSE